MKTLILTLFLYFSLFTANVIYAGNTNITANYPAPSGSYNKVMLETPQASTNITCNAGNLGLIFMDPATNTLQLCAGSPGNIVQIPYVETCFNRFCSYQSPAMACAASFTCPLNYTQAKQGAGNINDDFIAANVTGTNYHVVSTVCCSNGTANGQTNPAPVLPTS